MDHLLYIAMSGAKENMNGISIKANNLANSQYNMALKQI